MRANAKLWTVGVVLLLGSGSAAAATSTASIDTEFRAAYPLTAPSATTPIAGIQLAKLGLSGLQISARSEHAPEDGGIVLSLADPGGVVRVLLHLAVTADALSARKVLDVELHGVAAQLTKASDPMLGDLAYADDAGKGTAFLVATQANVAYSVAVVGDAPAGTPTAAAIAGLIRQAMVVGKPVFPAATVIVAPVIDARAGGAVRVIVPVGSSYKLQAQGGYMARRQTGPIVRPLAPGAVTVQATVVDELARVTVAAAATVAQ